MKRIRVIPSLLIQGEGLVKSIRFEKHQYIGDPINAVKIFNDKEVDEIVILDISATRERRTPNFKLIKKLTSEAFMPLGYGGGITNLNEIKELISAGVEKVILNYSAFNNKSLIGEAARYVGSQSTVVSIDVKKNMWGKYRVFVRNATKNTNLDPIEYAKEMANEGAGELLLNSIDKDGTFGGYDLELIKQVSTSVNIPVVAIGGAGGVSDFLKGVNSGASAVAAGSMFVLQRPHRAVLISYPEQRTLVDEVFSKI
jgi:imidazole glycerol-phosphate synthase subunit HisF